MFWTKSRKDTFEYVKLEWPSRREMGLLSGITGGSIDEDIDAELFASGSLDFTGDPGIDGNDVIRIFLNSEADGETERVALGTFLASTPTKTVSASGVSGQVELYSLLTVLQADALETTLTIPKNSTTPILADHICDEAHLSVSRSLSSKRTTELTTFEAGTSKLEVIRWMMEFADFTMPYTDPYGEVRFYRKTDPDKTTPVYTFVDGEGGIFLPDITESLDLFEVPNVVKGIYSGSAKTLTSEVVDSDPNSPLSTASRGRRVVHVEHFSDVDGISTEYQQASLNAKTAELAQELTAPAQEVSFDHAFRPLAAHNTVRLDYTGAGKSYRMGIVKRSIQLVPGALTNTTMRRYLPLGGA